MCVGRGGSGSETRARHQRTSRGSAHCTRAAHLAQGNLRRMVYLFLKAVVESTDSGDVRGDAAASRPSTGACLAAHPLHRSSSWCSPW